MLTRISIVLVLLFVTHTKFAFAEVPASNAMTFTESTQTQDSLNTVMQRMQAQTAVKITYQETRYLEMMQDPWEASGVMYALAPDVLVKEQQKPVREIMGVRGNQMFYFDPVNDVRHQGVMTHDDELSLNIAAFKALVNGDRQLLENMYHIAFTAAFEQWTLTLTGPGDEADAIKIIVTGATGKQADKIAVHQPDGDRSEFILAEAVRDPTLEKTILQLYQELLGE